MQGYVLFIKLTIFIEDTSCDTKTNKRVLNTDSY